MFYIIQLIKALPTMLGVLYELKKMNKEKEKIEAEKKNEK